MNNSHTTELASCLVNGSSVILYKTETPDFAVFTVVVNRKDSPANRSFFFDEQHEVAARKKYAASARSIAPC